MGMLQGKNILITGLLSDRSIAYGVASACKREGANLAFTYQIDKFKDRVTTLAKDFGSDLVLPCNVVSDQEIEQLFASLANKWDGLDGILHSIAFSRKEGLSGDLVDNVTREIFTEANDVSAYSFLALAKYGRKLMQGRSASLVTLSYLGAERVVPNYNMMGIAKAALEATTRYMAGSLGVEGIRVNAVSAGPIKTLAASGISGFNKILEHVEKQSLLKRNVTIEDVGNAAAFLLSSYAGGITGETLYVDSGYNVTCGGLDE